MANTSEEFMGIQLDPVKVWEVNNLVQGPDVLRKNGCLINTGSIFYNGSFVLFTLYTTQRKKREPERYRRTRKSINFPAKRLRRLSWRKENNPKVQQISQVVTSSDPITIRTENKGKLRRLKDILRYMEDRLNSLQGNGKGFAVSKNFIIL
jgi:hypothetical protein